ncbi:condensation domain-containing protein [Pseudomonas jinjuensis]|uniref:Acyl-CoA synthetase (AMP-forming)/AMP-acid ligase II n=1 Tax=Pseudomonas jinjuensis TaxID=198616 RepID=A0A1H0HX50_9PSED|nr:condensation domain-containing protein [Pseudomonas jinjuensis]SDO23786.1 Acyl-CoA synthetase (AMP-forming)/AMP-acid ligase II [Pseudomonas jinjuensis]
MTYSHASLVDALIARAASHGERPAVRFLVDGEQQCETLDYAELDRRARGLAVVLARHAEPGERALLLLHSGLEYVVGFYACLYAGIIAVPALPPESLRPQELNRVRAILGDAQPALILTDSQLAGSLPEAFEVALPTILAVDEQDLSGDGEWHGRRPEAESVAFLQYTSGSTATPKGVQVSHRNLVANEEMMLTGFDLHEREVFVSWLPLYHDMGLIGCLLQAIYAGATLILMSPRSFIERPARWMEAVSRYRASHTGGPDFAFRLAAERTGDAALANLDLSCLRVIYSGSEPIRHDSLAAFEQRFAPAGFQRRMLMPCYGLAEATLFVTGTPAAEPFVAASFDSHALGENLAQPGTGSLLVSSGIEQDGMLLRVVDPVTGMIQPDNRIGEIWTSGDSVAQGYWRNPEATAKAFVQRDGRTWLRTGDLGFLSERRLFITGRLKDVIIVRGQNLYPQDLERAVEYSVEGARKGRVIAFAVEHQGAEGIGIAVEIGRATHKKIDAAQLCAEIDRVVFDTCQQGTAWIALLEPGELPRTSSGKLQRSACRILLERGELACFHLQRAGELATRSGELPRDDTEQLVAQTWSEVLGIAGLYREDRFFALGGNSIGAVQVLARLRERLGVSLSLAALFEAADLAGFAAAVREAMQQPARNLPLAADPQAEPVLSHAQQRLWFAWQLDPQGAVYNVPLAVRLRGPLDIAALRGAFADLQARHAVLRTSFRQDADAVRPVVHQDMALDFAVAELTDLPIEQREAAAREQAAVEARLPFDLQHGPLQRVRLLRLDEREHILLLTIHHIAVDGWSMNILLGELERRYVARLSGQDQPLPALEVGYGDFARWQRQLLAADQQRQLDYWRDALAGEQAWFELHPQRPRAHGALAQCATFDFPAAQTTALRAFAAEQGATPFMLLLGAFAVVLAEHSGQKRIRLGSDIANRTHPLAESLVGFFINQLVLQVELRAEEGADALLDQCRRVVIDAADHQDLPFDRLVEELRPPRRAGRSPFFSIKLNYQEGEPPLPRLRDLRAEHFDGARQVAEMDLILGFYNSAGRLQARFETPQGLFQPGEITQLFAQLQAVLARWLAAPRGSQAELIAAAAQVRREAEAEANRQRQAQLAGQRPMRRRGTDSQSMQGVQ